MNTSHVALPFYASIGIVGIVGCFFLFGPALTSALAYLVLIAFLATGLRDDQGGLTTEMRSYMLYALAIAGLAAVSVLAFWVTPYLPPFVLLGFFLGIIWWGGDGS